MNKASNKGFAVGSTVVLTEEYISLFESFDLRNVLCEVVDARRAFGGYVYNVAPIGDRSRVVEAYASDLRAPTGCGVDSDEFAANVARGRGAS